MGICATHAKFSEIDNMSDAELLIVLNGNPPWYLKCIDIGHWEVRYSDSYHLTITGKSLQETVRTALKRRVENESI